VYALNVNKLTQIAGPTASSPGLDLKPGETAQLPNGLGSVTFDGVKRFASLDVHHDPTKIWVLIFAICILGGLLTSLFVPRRRMWVKAIEQPDAGIRVEYAGLARGDDPGLDAAVDALAAKHLTLLEPHPTQSSAAETKA
jgi:cytochrome c biogenesis protein